MFEFKNPIALAAVLGALSGGNAWALSAAECSALASLNVSSTTITSAAIVPAAGGVPEYCRVAGHVDTEINFELHLPTTTWNGKLLHTGGGGFVGYMPTDDASVARGYAVVGTDTGHVSNPAALDGSWALDRPDRQVNFGHRAIHVVTVAAKSIVNAAYRQQPRYSYFQGCSNGGRQAAMEAQRYPADFDGIISGAPALDWTGLMTGFNWDEQSLQGAAAIPPSQLPLIANEAARQCDANDGLVDGLLDNPLRCRFDPSVLLCKPGKEGPNCLNHAQLQAVKNIYAGPSNTYGEQLHPGFPWGAEDGGDGWELWISGPASGSNGSLQFIFQDQYLRYFIFGPSYNSLTFNFDRGPRILEEMTASFLNATNPDLSAFNARGGKLIMWHGWSDHALTTVRTVQYYDEVVHRMGNKNRIADFFRLFLAPGMHHCGGGPGLNAFDALTPLEKWVEQGVAPDSIIASHAGPGIARTRPLCSYPAIAVYDGKGDPNSAASFACKNRGLGYALKGFESDDD
jgi:feruloyl esterase